jgi:hypothetical protein
MSANPVETAATAADIARGRVTTTMDDIQQRLDPRRIVGDAVARVQTGSRALAVQAGDAAKAHPVALGAAVLALGLALLARNQLSKAKVDLEGAADYTDYDDGYGDETAYDDRSPPSPAPSSNAGSTSASSADSAAIANPGVSIIIGLLSGAILGALLPVSQAERRTLGETAHRLGAAAKSAANAAGDALDAAKAQRKG